MKLSGQSIQQVSIHPLKKPDHPDVPSLYFSEAAAEQYVTQASLPFPAQMRFEENVIIDKTVNKIKTYLIKTSKVNLFILTDTSINQFNCIV